MVIFIPYSSSKRGTIPNAMENFENPVSSLAPRSDPAASETSQTYATSEAFQPFTTLDLDPFQNKTC